jgi:hypothetical protein
MAGSGVGGRRGQGGSDAMSRACGPAGLFGLSAGHGTRASTDVRGRALAGISVRGAGRGEGERVLAGWAGFNGFSSKGGRTHNLIQADRPMLVRIAESAGRRTATSIEMRSPVPNRAAFARASAERLECGAKPGQTES